MATLQAEINGNSKSSNDNRWCIVLTIEPRSGDGGDEELRALGVRAGVGHAQVPRLGVLDLEVLVCNENREVKYTIANKPPLHKAVHTMSSFLTVELAAIDGFSAGAGAVNEITALDHEVRDHSVELGALIVQRLAIHLANSFLARAQSSEVLSSLGDGFAE